MTNATQAAFFRIVLPLYRKGPLHSRLLVNCAEDFSGSRVN